MSRTILITENQLNSIVQTISLKNLFQEDYTSDVQKKIKSGAKQTKIKQNAQQDINNSHKKRCLHILKQ